MDSQSLYGERAELYDLLYSFKDYDGESARLRELLRAEGVADGAALLEAACGTGAYLERLQRWYQVSGVDVNAGVLEVARQKLPEVDLLQADMAELTLAEPVDALVCLFSSIGYVFPEERLRQTARSFHAALRPGGVLLVEPWLTPDGIEGGRPSVQTYESEDLKLVRANVTRVEGQRSLFDFHWLVVPRDRPVEHFVEQHELWLCPRETMTAAFEDAGFEVRWDEEGLTGRGLLVGRREV
jgi:SAM-dependent methyltransferase